MLAHEIGARNRVFRNLFIRKKLENYKAFSRQP